MVYFSPPQVWFGEKYQVGLKKRKILFGTGSIPASP
jgi:hypothetical protein